MNHKRDRLEVIFDILSIIRRYNNSIKPTPLARFSNLSTKSFKIYEQELLEKGFMRDIYDKKNKKFFTLTDKGFDYIYKYKTIREFVSNFDL